MATDLQVLATFDATRIEAALRSALANAGVDVAVGFTARPHMRDYMLTPSAETEHIAGTVVLVRVEDWLRDHCSSEGHPGDAWAREELKSRVKEFASELAILAYRGKPVWFLACPSTGWVAEQHKMAALCRTYTNLLAVRAGGVAQIVSVSWPAGLAGNDIAADQADNIPYTQEVFDRLGEVLAAEISGTLKSDSTEQSASGKSPELAAYMAGLQVRVSLAPADVSTRKYVDKIIRTAASFSLCGEQPHIVDSEVDAVIASGNCVLVAVSDRLADHGPSGVVAYRESGDEMVVRWMSLSCPVLGKQVEFALMTALAQMARERGSSRLVFQFQPSERNPPIQKFLQSLAESSSENRYLLPVAEADARIAAAAVNPGAWSVSFSRLATARP